MAPRPWTCRKCKHRNPTRMLKHCTRCGKARPTTKPTPHTVHRDSLTYDDFIAINGGDFCWLHRALGEGDGRSPSGHRFHRDHDWNTGAPRGLLCFQHNVWVKRWMTPERVRAVLAYLERTEGTATDVPRVRLAEAKPREGPR